ncbi:hypothetical protein BJP40_16435 [Streptomyces sp. CC53]|uniref:hypothetical protein n=1 Tax=unclassified Streptomyces TaxID=2593676 RepID=UPI0008DDDC8D|nr:MULTISPECIES: hypothetical protein [unclassified Streptomyces]OII65617.1 hypothetical protein BJP40_16435 [Streptomyces sp. CC53]OII67149.1 hypothetical protein BJP39_25920 [Streptomyces sp. CC77]
MNLPRGRLARSPHPLVRAVLPASVSVITVEQVVHVDFGELACLAHDPHDADPPTPTRGMDADDYGPDRYDIIGALVCLADMAVIIYSSLGH